MGRTPRYQQNRGYYGRGNEGDRHRTSHASSSRQGSPGREGDRRGNQNASYYGGGDQAHGRRTSYHDSYEQRSNWRDSNEYEYDRSRRDDSSSNSYSYFQNRQWNSSANRTDMNKEVKGENDYVEGGYHDTFRASAVKVDHTQIQNNDAPPPVPRKIAAKTEDGKRKMENSSTHAATAAVNTENNARPPHKKPKSEFDSIVINKANWDSASLDEKLMSQYPSYDNDIVNLRIRDLIQEDPLGWMSKKIKAAQQALDKINAEIEDIDSELNDAPYDSEDSPPAYHEHTKVFNSSPAGLEDFVSSLPYCILFDQGFLMWGSHIDDETYCFCPCSKKMEKWRNNFDLCEPIGIDNCGSFRQNTPNALMDHLKKIGEDESAFLHRAVHYYLRNLYKNYWNHVEQGIHHKGLYAVLDPGYHRAEAAKRNELSKAFTSLSKEKAKTEIKLREMDEAKVKAKELKKLNKDLYEDLKGRYLELERTSKALNIKPEKRKTINDLSAADLEHYRYNLPELMKAERDRVLCGDTTVDIKIKLPPKIVVQHLFDQWYSDKKKDALLCLFCDFESESDNKPKRLLKTWDVQIATVEIYTKKDAKKSIAEQQKKEVAEEIADLTAIDHGGPTKAFVQAFCDQLGDIVVRIPICQELNDKGRVMDPSVGSSVLSILDHGTGIIIEKKRDKSFLVEFEDCSRQTLLRDEFKVKEVAIPLFDYSGDSGLVPQRDYFFESIFAQQIQEYDSAFDLDKVIEKAKKYYRAIGRFISHIIFGLHDVVKLSTMVLPEMLRNLILRNVPPDSERYSMSDLASDLHKMEMNFSIEKQTSIKTEKGTFEMYMLDEEFLSKHGATVKAQDTTADNFRTFVSLYALKSRDIAISSLTEGITLNGYVKLNAFSMVPSFVLDTLLFADPCYDVEDILCVFNVQYLPECADEQLLEAQKLCFRKTLPEALRILNEKNKSFVAEFLVYVTASSYLPNFDMNPQFEIVIEFVSNLDNDSLPTAATCHNTLHLPAWSYNNDVEKLCEKIGTAVKLGASAGFGFA